MNEARIAVVDDEADLRGAVAAFLALQGFDAVECDGGRALDAAMTAQSVDLVVLDVTMPDEDGFAIARRLRVADAGLGIIMLTARTELADRIVGLEIGADDYLAKPFELRELVARIRAVLRRSATARDRPGVAKQAYFDALWVQDRGQLARVAVEDIEWIEADRDYVLLHTAQRAHSLRATMDELEKQLDPARMIRVHRSTFVPTASIAAFRRQGRGGKVTLANGRSIAIGPAYVGAVIAVVEV
ncbi:MAG TPA: response regulator [Sphingomonas sp.]|jgi:DNA-binding response OmpR family regulator